MTRTARPVKKQRRLGKEEWYVTAMRGFVFGQAPIKNRHAFGNTPEKKGWGLGTEQKRSKRIAKDMSELPSQLPCHFESSVFMRFEETDQTILRALFLPGCDTPYGGGAFDFDISLPGSYPAVAPQVKLRTTGGGSVRFNPNLYACGKVCLSLLGTWAGPGWDPKVSTLLQVLVSIQSMIFVEDPFFNEPGHEAGRHTDCGKTQSTAYTLDIRSKTLQHAMLSALRVAKSNDGAFVDNTFREVLRRHYELKSEALRAMLDKWRYEDIMDASTNKNS